jgi:hypothetical protein
MARKKTRAEIDEERRQGRANTEWLRELANRALADLELARGGPVRRPESSADWLRELAAKAQADLDRGKQQSA